jgi:putative DNA primase/helicase
MTGAPFAVTFFADFAARTKTEESLSLEQVAERVRTTSATEKSALPWLKFARFGNLPNPKTSSGSLRWNGNLFAISGVVADYDGGEMTLEEAAERLDKAGIDAIVYTSPSHRYAAPRWRACCPFSAELPPDRHYQMVARLNGVLGSVLAPESFTLSQAYYFGSVNGNPGHRAIVVEGAETIERADELDEIAIGKPNGDGKGHASGKPEASIEDIRAALAVIPNPVPSWGRNASWTEWNNLGMAVWRASGGSEEGFKEFDKWSSKSPKYDSEESEFRWRHYFDSPPSAIGFGSLVHWAREIEPGWMPPSKRTDKPIITIEGGNQHIAADQGIAALVAGRVPFYQRDRRIQRVALVPAKNTNGDIIKVPGIVSVDAAMMGRELGRSASWQRYDLKRKKDVVINPPPAVSSQILSMVGQWPFPPLTGLIQCPTLRPNGTLLTLPGYDAATGLVLTDDVAIPQIQPTRAAAEKALELLRDLLTEFPFVDQESLSVALSMIITPVVRGAMTVAPMHLITAPLPGSGKSYLADCASMIATGERCAVKAAAPSYEETEKRLVGSALAGYPIIALDNCRDDIAGDFFCQIVERPLLELRALGKSPPHRIPNSFTMFVNGNNAAVAGDMVRRTIKSGLDANLEHPETRFFRGDPLATIRKNRGKYIAAALTIPSAYVAAGQPPVASPVPSFEGWCAVVRAPLIWLGCADPVATQAKLRTDDPRQAEKTLVFDAWKAELGVGHNRRCSTKELVEAASIREPLKDALLAIAATRFTTERKIDPKALGKWLSRQEGAIAGKCKLFADRTNAAVPRWYLDLHG